MSSGGTEHTMEERMAAFRSDPQLMEAATKFVNDVLEKAKEEALRRLKEKAAADSGDAENAMEKEKYRQPTMKHHLILSLTWPVNTRKRGRWHSRARGFFMRVFASLCLCNSNGAKGS
ncbi:uncharacterized protein LOC110837857 isoform X1 [Zootermopsis nevadensis]|uniref:uncharacterized protein LOC110837857 isoform X1 n=1 Tax=Zootermopsis nevadensis TaxID=136037 RepID=UPI000B8E373A|nr:uncharacterized protein LOC110837857 isoform X1 [Zootermopsis nevadensis]XP_021936144.1 uncharacterized protein LOC110837857 isoform X1 [Zootermopsis nevadensis]XP_021936151.1 uncharacterized protein LOC110837857 isoform X1 [Zootermopsis nevadensis]